MEVTVNDKIFQFSHKLLTNSITILTCISQCFFQILTARICQSSERFPILEKKTLLLQGLQKPSQQPTPQFQSRVSQWSTSRNLNEVFHTIYIMTSQIFFYKTETNVCPKELGSGEIEPISPQSTPLCRLFCSSCLIKAETTEFKTACNSYSHFVFENLEEDNEQLLHRIKSNEKVNVLGLKKAKSGYSHGVWLSSGATCHATFQMTNVPINEKVNWFVQYKPICRYHH